MDKVTELLARVETIERNLRAYDEQCWRYLFAGLAMQGLLSNGNLLRATILVGKATGLNEAQSIDAFARSQADALLAELKRTKQETTSDG